MLILRALPRGKRKEIAMPINIEVYEKIRKLFVQGMSKRAIARELGCSRHTVDKYCEGAFLPERQKETKPRTAPLRDAILPRLQHYLKLNEELPGKQKMSAHTIWLHLSREGYVVAESTVRRWISELKKKSNAAFVPLEFGPGEVMQFDWGQAYAYIAGVRTLVHNFCAVLPHSFALHVSVFPDETSECFFLGHIQAFQFLGGIAETCVYDNLKSAVFSGSGKEAVQQERFKQFAAHHVFTPRFCNAASGWEKSAVENTVSIIRRVAFAPMPRVGSWQELQQLVTARCLAYCETHRVKRRQYPIKQAWEEEKKHLHPMPLASWDPSLIRRVLVHKDSTCIFQTNRYSVPVTLVGKDITLKASPFHVRFFAEGQEMAAHSRSYDKNQTFYEPEHYLPLLEMKPGAVNNAAPLRQGNWPKEIQNFKKRYKRNDLYQCLVHILRLLESYPKDLVLKGVDWASRQQEPSFELILHFIDVNQDPKLLDDHIEINPTNLKQYDLLLGEDDDPDDNNKN